MDYLKIKYPQVFLQCIKILLVQVISTAQNFPTRVPLGVAWAPTSFLAARPAHISPLCSSDLGHWTCGPPAFSSSWSAEIQLLALLFTLPRCRALRLPSDPSVVSLLEPLTSHSGTCAVHGFLLSLAFFSTLLFALGSK